jgi:predicted transcriptional regulator
MHMYIKALFKVAGKYAPSRSISFDIVHIFKTFQLIEDRGHVSRGLLSKELALGSGIVKTLIKHLKMQGMIHTTKTGTKMTEKGKSIYSHLRSSVPAELNVPKCSVALGKFNYAVLLKKYNFAIKSGIEQRDAAIKMGAKGATTLLFKDGRFVMPSTKGTFDPLHTEPEIHKLLINRLQPIEDGDAIIIGSDDGSKKRAELAAKSAALLTIMNHEKHDAHF